MSYMETLTKRQVGQTPALLWSTAVRCSHAGEALFILEKGVPTYRVEYVGPTIDPLAALATTGTFTPASTTPRPAPRLKTTYTPDQVRTILDDLRGEQ